MKQEHKEYLDELRASGEINMFGAGAYLEGYFHLSRKKAVEILQEWMKGFTSENDTAKGAQT